jgi:uncharacterized protein (TIGR03437 family)
MKRAFLVIALIAARLLAMPSISSASSISYLQLISDQFQETVDVYTDADAAGNHFLARGEFDAAGQDLVPAMDEISANAPCFSGITCITATYDASRVGWGGWYWLNGVLGPSASAPSANWGSVPNAGYDLTGATMLRFWARGLVGGERVHFFAFGVGNTAPPYQPYPDSSPKREISGGAVTLTSSWTMYQIPLAGLDLHYVLGGFAWEAVASEQQNPGPIVFYLDQIQYVRTRPSDPRFLVSYQTIKSTNAFDTVMRNPGFTYDQSVALMALLASGDLARATTIADAIVYAQNHDRFFTDSRIRNAIKGGDISLPQGWTPNGLTGTVSMPGWYSPDRSQWFEDATQVSSNTGNVIWAGLAMMHIWQATKNAKYLQAAQGFGNWVIQNTSETRGGQAGALQGFTGGVEGWESNAASPSSSGPQCNSNVFSNGQCKRLYKSTEHNIDAAAFFSLLFLADGSPKWAGAAASARHFLLSMWNGLAFWTGTAEDGATISTDVIPLDIQVWSLLALGSEAQPYVGTLPYIEANHKTSLGYGFKQNSSSNSCGNNTWFEGTSQVADAYKLIAQDTAKWQSILNLSQVSQDSSGGMPATDGTCLNTGFTLDDGTAWLYYPRLHVGATGWRALAELGVNPYRSDLYSPALSTQTLDFGQYAGIPTTKTFTFSNPGPFPLSIASIAVTGTNAAEFSEKNSCSSTLSSLASCTVTVTFSPASSGPKAASVVVTETSDSAMLPAEFTVTLTGSNEPSTATFTLSINVTPSIGGTVTASPASTNGTYNAGTNVCLTPAPAQGWTFVRWSGPQLDSNGCLTMDADESVTALFSGNLRIIIDSISSFGSDPGIIVGHVVGSGLPSVRIAPFLFHTGLGWYTKSSCAATTVPVDPASGAFSVPFTSGGVDRYGTQFALIAVPASLTVGCYTGLAGLPGAVTQNAIASLIVRRPDPQERTITFASQAWGVKATAAAVGPGSCVFADSAANVYIDGSGRLHLVAVNSGGWTCAEVFTRAAVGYGVYKWTIDSAPALDPAGVFGAFTWEDAVATPNEIDVEFGFPQAGNNTNSQEVVQPYGAPGNLTRTTLPTGAPLTFVMTWLPSGLKFQVYLGVDDSGNKIQEWQYQGTPPVANGLYQNFRFNVWFNGTPASTASSQEVVIDSFVYQPFTADPTPPVVSSVVSPADYSPAAAPGAAASAFGTGLSTGSPSAGPVPLPLELGSVSATVNGLPVPLFYSDKGLLNIQIPAVTPPGPGVIGAVVNGKPGHLFPFNILPTAPSLFRSAIGAGCLAQNQDYTLNSAANPAKPSSVIVVYLTGIGAVDSPVADGYPAPSSPLSRPLAPTTATLGGLPATVQFVGLTPSLVAVAQANILVPPTAAGGQQTLAITIGSYTSAACNISVAAGSLELSITTTSVPNATVGTSYSTPLAAVGGAPPYKAWTVSSGSLPPGLRLDGASGVISGTPTSATGSPFGFSVQVMDSNGAQSPAQMLSIVVNTNTTFTISGHATLQGSGTPVAGVVVSLSGTQTASATTAADGSYQFTGLHYGDNYGLSAAKTGYGVSPNFTGGQISGNVTADFTVFYLTLSGRVVDQNNAGISGVLVTVTGSHPATATTAADGSFSIYGFLSTDTYTAVPSKTGYTFSPAQYSNTIGTNANISFVGTNTTFTVSGHATLQGSGTPVAGVVVSLSGTQTASATTAADGSYQFTGLHYGDNYGLSAAKTGYGVSPNFTGGQISGNVTADFTVFYLTLSGRVVDQNNTGISGVLVTVTGSHPATATTAADGSFSIYGFLSTDTYTAVPSKTGYTFSPAQYSNTIGTNAIISFVGTNTTFTITGHATLQGSGTPVTGVVVSLSGTQTASATTAADGSYQFTGLHYGDNYGLSAAKTGYGVSPNFTGGQISGNVTADFTVFYLTLSGRVVDQNNAGISGTLVTVTGSHPATATTAADGSFSIYGFLSTDTYTAVPSKAGYTFSPAQYSNTIGTNANISFVGTNTTFTITGHATLQGSGTPVAGVVVSLSGTQTASATTAADGSYQFTGLHYGDNYGLSAAKTGYGVSPNFTGGQISGNVTANFTIFSLLTVTTSSLANGAVGAPYSQTLSAGGGTPPYNNWALTGGSLVPGLSLNTVTGVISGTPTSAAGSPYVFSVSVRDSSGAVSPAQSLSITIQASTISNPAITASVQGGTVSGTVSGVSPAQAFRVAVFARTNQFYIQPCILTPLTSISANGTWSTLSHDGDIFALLVTSDYTPPDTAGSLPAVDGRYVLASIGPVGTVVNSDVAACPAQ